MEALLDKILSMLKAAQLEGIRTYLFGDPILYPEFDLPAVVVAPSRDDLSAYTTAKDMHNLVVDIYVIQSARDGYNQTVLESPVDRSLIQLADVIVATLREDVSLGGTVANFQDCTVQYVPAIRGREAVRMAQISARFNQLKAR